MGRLDEMRERMRRVIQQQEHSPVLPEAPTPVPEPVATEPVQAVPALPSVNSRDDAEVPHALRIASAWTWRLLIIATGLALVLWLVGQLSAVLIPLSIALLLSALLSPMVGTLNRLIRLPRSLATGVVMIAGIAAVAGTLTLVITQFISGFPSLSQRASDGVQQIQDWMQTGPLHIKNASLTSSLNAASNWISDHQDVLTSSAVATAAATLEALASLFLVLFSTFFFLRDGRRIWRFVTSILPRGAREPVAAAGEAAWHTLVAYVRATVLVAFIDAVGIGTAILICRVHFAFPLAALVFICAFVPIVGATVSGAVAVLVGLVDRGPLYALIIFAAVIVVQQTEGHVLQPVIMGRAVSIHPLAVIVAIAAGVVLAGIIGALVAVPIVAVLNTGIRHLLQGHRTDPDAVVVSARPSTE